MLSADPDYKLMILKARQNNYDHVVILKDEWKWYIKNWVYIYSKCTVRSKPNDFISRVKMFFGIPVEDIVENFFIDNGEVERFGKQMEYTQSIIIDGRYVPVHVL